MRQNLFNRKKVIVIVFQLFAVLGTTFTTNAQAPDSSKKYQFFLEPYLMFTSMSGTTGIGNLPNTFLCIPASDVFSHLNFGGMLYAELHNNRFAFTSDLFYASLSQDASGKNGIITGTVNLKQFLWELEGLYKLNPWLEAGIGFRINSIESGLNINFIPPGGGTPTSQSEVKSNGWVDPLIVTRLKTWLDNKWLLALRVDIGGFGVGSQFAWQLQPDIAFRASKLLQLGLGYRYLFMDYNHGSGSSRFYFNMQEYGPQIRIGFNF
jgi:hypothetical protein